MPAKKPIPIQKSASARIQQPMKATQPYHLLQGSPVRKSPSSSPTPRGASVRNWWPSDRSSPDRGDRKSPSSPSIKVPNRRSPSPSIRKTPTLDSITGPYLTGQWPRDFLTSTHQYVMRDKMTQTQESDWNNDYCNKPIKSSGKSGRSSTIADPDFKQMRKQLRTIAKRSSDKKARSPPVHGNHSALQQLPAPHPRSTPISIGNQPFGRIPRRQNSAEALNKEVIEYINNSSLANEARHFQGISPLDGRRAPLPRSSTRTMETQTPQDIPFSLEQLRDENESVENSPRSSPAEQQTLAVNSTNAIRSSTDPDAKEFGVSPYPKYASSPRPNNSYTFKREPPEGAENVKPFKEMDTQQRGVFTSCPDVKKINFNKSISSAFSAPIPKLIQPFSAGISSDQASGNAFSSSIIVNDNNSSSSGMNNGGSNQSANNNNLSAIILNTALAVVNSDA